MKKYIFLGLSNTVKDLLKYAHEDEVYAVCEPSHTGEVFEGKPVISIGANEVGELVEKYDFVLTAPTWERRRNDAAFFRQNNLPFMWPTEYLLEQQVFNSEAYPYPIKHLLDTYGEKELRQPTEEEEALIKEYEEKYRAVIIGVVHPTAIGAFCWTFGGFAEEVCRNRRDDVAYGICRGDHPFMGTVKKFYVPNEFLFKKFLEAFPTINRSNVIPWCVFICRHIDRLQVYDYTGAFNRGQWEMRQFYKDPRLEPMMFPPKRRIKFTMDEVREGEKRMGELGILRDYVCFFSRERAYIDKTHDTSLLTWIKNDAGNIYRNSEIDRYKLMAEKLEERGVQSVRMGSVVSKAYTGKGVDYGSLGPSEFMDAYLYAHCLFSINDNSGIERIPYSVFGKPIVTCMVPTFLLFYRDHISPMYLVLFYKLWDEKNGRYLNLRDCIKIGMSNKVAGSSLDVLYEMGIKREDITDVEIWEVAEEMLNILNGTQKYTEEDYALRRKFQSIVAEYTEKDSEISALYGRPSAAWLRKNQWFLE